VKIQPQRKYHTFLKARELKIGTPSKRVNWK